MKVLCAALLVVTGLFVSGCIGYVAPVMPPQGFLFSNVSAPIDTDYEKTPVGYKSGASSSTAILSLFAFGDASVSSAARNGSLETIDHVDYEYMNILFIYQSFTVRAYGD